MLLPHILNIRKNKRLFSDRWIFCRATPVPACFLFTPPPTSSSPPRSILTPLVYSLTGLQPVTVRAGPGSGRTAHADPGGVLRPVCPLWRVRGVVLQQHGGGGLARDIHMARQSTRPPESRPSVWCGSEDSPAEVCSVLTSHTSSIYSLYYPHRSIPSSSSLHPACLVLFREAERIVDSPAAPVGPAGVRTNAPSVWFLNKRLPAKLDPDPLGRRGPTGTLTIFFVCISLFSELSPVWVCFPAADV